MPSRRVHFTFDAKRGDWKAEVKGSSRALARGETKAEVQEAAMESARAQGDTSVIIHGKNGRSIRSVLSRAQALRIPRRVDSALMGNPIINPPREPAIGFHDDAEWRLPCPGCGTKTPKTLSWFRSRPASFECSRCGEQVQLNLPAIEQFAASIERIAATIELLKQTDGQVSPAPSPVLAKQLFRSGDAPRQDVTP